MNLTKVTGKLKEQIAIFSGKLSCDLPKTARRFVEEALYGIQSRQSVRLSEIGRSLNERISLIKTINRLSFQLSREGLWQKVTDALLRLAAPSVGRDTLLVLDLSDINKPYAKSMEYLDRVRDGSTGELVDGYWTTQVIAAEVDKPEVIPLYGRLYSIKAPDCTGENQEIFKAVTSVSRAVGNRGIWVIDRGGDRRILFDHLLTNHKRFIIRLTGNRTLIHKGEKVIALPLASMCSLPHTDIMVREEEKSERIYRIRFGFCRVYLPDLPLPLSLVVVAGFGQKPMMLLTNLPLKKDGKVILNIIKSYLTRWRIEETIRFIKQSYEIEDIRVQTYARLHNMMVLVFAAAYFAAVYIGSKLKMKVLSAVIIKISQRIFGVADFRYYAIADGIKRLLGRDDKGLWRPTKPWVPKTQLSLLPP